MVDVPAPATAGAPGRRARALAVAAPAALAAGMCWMVKGCVILVTGVQPPLLFEAAPLLMGVAVLALAGGTASGRRRTAAAVLGAVAVTAAVPVLADEVVALADVVTGAGMAVANVAVLIGLAVLGSGRGRAGPAGLLPLGLAVGTVPAVLLGGALTVLLGERVLELPVVVLGLAWVALGIRLMRLVLLGRPTRTVGPPVDRPAPHRPAAPPPVDQAAARPDQTTSIRS